MFCNPCKYEKINQIKLYDFIVDECSECEYCSIPVIEYFNFIRMVIIKYHFLNISILTDIDILPKHLKNKYQMLFECFSINLNNLFESNYQCRICGEDFYEIKKDKNFSLYFCQNCMNIFFNKKDFKKYVEKEIKFINKFYYFIYMKERFLQLFKKRG